MSTSYVNLRLFQFPQVTQLSAILLRRLIFTHFDEVKGDNLIGLKAQKEHVIGSYFNAVQAIGKASGREAENALKRLHPDRIVFLANIQCQLPDKAKFTCNEFSRILDVIEASIQPPLPVQYCPVYDVANLVLAVQKATQEFHDRWKAILAMGSRANIAPEHWTRIKALTRRVGARSCTVGGCDSRFKPCMKS